MHNQRGGKNYKKKKKGGRFEKNRELILASSTPGHQYAKILKIIGTGFNIECANKKIEKATIRGAMRSKVWVRVGNIVLVDSSELNKHIIIHKYNDDEVAQL